MSPEARHMESYAAWRIDFARERLRTLYYLGLVANPIFLISDLLFYRDQLPVLFGIRAIIEVGFLLVLFGQVYQPLRVRPQIPLIVWVLIGNLCIAQMTVYLGGFTSAYFNGFNLVFLAAAVIVPISWRAHLFSQGITLAYYYGANLIHPLGAGAQAAAIQNAFFLLWTCVACLFAVYLYEQLQTAEFQARLSERHVREELEVSHRKLLELDRLKDQFFANISHELRTPLTVSLGAFNTLLKAPLPTGAQDVVRSGLRNTSRLLFLINELLELARFESGRTDLRKVCVDLVSLLKSVAANFESSEQQRIFIEGAEQAIPTEIDVRKMMKVFYNLLANAFKFSDPERGQVWIHLSHDESRVSIAIRDNGIGIPEEHFEHIFDRFTQVEGDATRRFEGSGIGLALAKEIVTLHGGQIAVQSRLGEGSTFTVTVPRGNVGVENVVPVDEDEIFVLPVAHEHHRSVGLKAIASGGSAAGRPIVIVVDDNADMRTYLARLLTDNYHVVTAVHGADALVKMRQAPPALVVADIMMPVMSGRDLLQAMRKEEGLRRIPVILLTARAGTEARVESLESGAADYVSKPFHEEELLARIKNQLRLHHQERELEAHAKELENLYAKVEAVNAELRRLNERKSEFVSMVSHDLRTPLAAMRGFVENLLDELGGPLGIKQRQYLERIKANIDRLVRMINDLLDLAKIEAGTVEFHPSSIPLIGFVHSLVETLQPVAREKSIDLHVEAGASELVVYADIDKLTQVLTNLVHNACKFTQAGGIVRIELVSTEQSVQVCVADTGCGIASEEIPHLFEKFYRGRSSSTERRGTGLGLAIAKHFVELHQGRIWVESKEHEGSRFYFMVPRDSRTCSISTSKEEAMGTGI